MTGDTIRHLLRTLFGKNEALGRFEDNVPAGSFRFLQPENVAEDDDRLARLRPSRGYRAALTLLGQALVDRATDIHVETGEQITIVRYRIDGVLCNQEPLTRAVGDAVVETLKVLADLDAPMQDGIFRAEVAGRHIDFRVRCLNSESGEKMVVRIHEPRQKLLSLGQLGLRDRVRDQILSIVQKKHGLLLACGPTGAGKTQALYSCLSEIDRYQQKVVTLENFVEYRLDHVTQIEVSEQGKRTFAGELRRVLRQEADVILVGEIRDRETAELACQAAATGRLVFSTLEAGDCISALQRLLDLGIEPRTLAPALSGILGQRLVRLLCTNCRVRYKPNAELLTRAGLPADRIKHFHRPPTADEAGRPCSVCGGLGFRQRTGVFELLVVNGRIRQLLQDSSDLAAVEEETVKKGMGSLYDEGIRLVIEGKTSLPELQRALK